MLAERQAAPAPFLDIRRLVTAGGEQGLLGLAFHPPYPKRAQALRPVHGPQRLDAASSSTGRTGRSASSPRQLFSSRDPYGNHNGGMLAFGPNGRLYFTMGDGGAGGDPENRSQNLRSLFGKLLSMNVATKGLKIEALGLRNAWRFSFDRANGDLYIGDVGQGELEEINCVPASSAGPRELRLGRLRGPLEVRGQAARAGQARPAGRPVLARRTAARSRAATSTAARTRPLRGRYIYGDYCSGIVWSFKLSGGKATGAPPRALQDRRASPRSARTTPASSTASRTAARSTA